MEIGCRYRLGAFLGKGASGDVYEGIDTDTGARVAIKVVDCRRLRSIAELEALQEEAALLSGLRHRFIVRMLDIHINHRRIAFVMEHAGGGTLQQLLQGREGQKLEEAEAQRIFHQIFQAVEYCHRRLIVHRDLKPENVLLDQQGNVKVADFGLASLLTPFDGDVSTLAGTPEFMAPDLLTSAACDGAKADMWSLGVMLYECLAGRTPFTGPNLSAILRAATRNDYQPLPEGVSGECRGLVAALLQPDPGRRITLEAALQHPWLCQGLEHGGELPALPSSAEASELAAEGQPGGAAGGAAPAAAGEGRAAGGEGGTGAPAGQAGSRPGSSCGRSPSLSLQHSSLELQLPGGMAPPADPLPPVAEEASCSSSLSLRAPAADGGSEPGTTLERGRSGDMAKRQPDGGSPTSRQLKQLASFRSLNIGARAAGGAASPLRRTASAKAPART